MEPLEVYWLNNAAQDTWGHAIDLLHRQGTQCLVAAVHDRDEALSLLARAHSAAPGTPIVLTIDDYRPSLAAELRQAGAFDAVPADTPRPELDALIAQARSLAALTPRPLPRVDARPWRRSLVGHCQAIESLADAISLIAERRSTVLITGETGTGKEVVARAIHEASGRTGQMISLNCTALPESLLEAELFGHTKGAFTGAQSARAGRFEAAHRGTIFLDEIGDMPLELQAKLLRVLQEREIQRLGSSETIPVDVRVIAATNADLLSKVEDGRFREDLYFRLNVVPIHLPPLRERTGDLPLLASHFITRICDVEGLPPKTLTAAALRRLEEHHWPGNVRELENTIERAIALSGRRMELLPADFLLPNIQKKQPTPALGDLSALTIPDSGIDFEEIIAGIERNMIEQALRRTNGNKSAAAELLRLKRTTLGAKMRTLGTAEPHLIRALTA